MRLTRRLAAVSASLLLAVALVACGGSTPPPREVTVVSEDGFRLAATLYGKGRNGVVAIPDANSSKSDLDGLAQEFAAKGMTVLALNPRGFPGSDGVRDYQIMDRDVVGAARYLSREQGVDKIALVGVGSGGTVAYKASSNPDVMPRSVVAVSSPLKFQALDATRAAMAMVMPKMLVESADDKEALEQARETFKVFPEPKVLEEVPGKLRSTELVRAPEASALRTSMIDYVKKSFG